MSHSEDSRGADRVAQALAACAVERVFSLSGNQIMALYDALLDVGIEIVHTRHEAAAVHMADAWGRLNGQPGVALLTAGPGHANGVSALYSALMAESPVLSLSGHAPISRLGQGPFQEMAQALMAAPVCKAAWTVEQAEKLSDDITRAFNLCRDGRPGPVHLSLPVDLLESYVAAWPETQSVVEPLPSLTGSETESLATALCAANRPLVLAGASFARGSAAEALRKLEAASGIPCIAMESPRGLSDPALGALAECVAASDRILLLAKRPDFSLAFAEPPHIGEHCDFLAVEAEIDTLDSTRVQLGERLIESHHADPVNGCLALAHALDSMLGDTEPNWLDAVTEAIEYRPPDWQLIESDSERGVHPSALCRQVGEFLKAQPSAVLVCDGGEFGQWAQAMLGANERIINGPSGAIGGALSFAAAAALARPDATVLAMLGDGTIGFHLSEFDTALRAGARFIAIVGNDARWNAEHQIQLREFGERRLVGCELLPTRYDRAAAGLGAHGEHVTRSDELLAALKRALASGLPACINVALDGQPATGHSAPLSRPRAMATRLCQG